MRNPLPGVDPSSGTSSQIGTHTPVLLDEVLKFMAPSPGKKYIDATTGPGNMSKALLEKCSPDGRVLSIDCDPHAISQQEETLKGYGTRSVRVKSNFADIREASKNNGFLGVDGIIYDLGVSSGMLDLPVYGMSFRHDAKLDMRFDPDLETSAYDLVNGLPEGELVELLRGMDEKRFGRKIAKAIVAGRSEGPIETTGQLAEIVASAVPRRFHPRGMHVATRTFLSLRASVNSEKENLERSLTDCPDILATDGVLVVICYSSFEDRVVKALYRENRDRFERLTRKIITPSDAEIERNPRSRSARLRAYRKRAYRKAA